MNTEEKVWDVVIVGAGPAGLAAGLELAKAKREVLILDRKQEIGCPKRCAEGLSLRWFNILGIKPTKEMGAVQPIDGAVLYSPNSKSVKMKSKEVLGYVLERKMFEKYLAIDAVKKGAKIFMKQQVIGAEKKSDHVELKLEVNDEIQKVKTKLVIACDGVDSLTAKMLGLNTGLKLQEIDSGYQYEMTGVSGYDENCLHLFFGTDVAPRGYCLTPETEVVMSNSVKPINEIVEGDCALTLNGWSNVNATSEREYNGQVIDITPRMINKKVGVTEDHLVLTWNKKTKYLWKKAKDVARGNRGKRGNGDYLVFPKPKEEETKTINVSDYYTGIEKNGKLYPKGRNQFGAEFCYKHGIKKELTLDEDLLYLMGFFVAEGNTNSNGIILSNTKKDLIDGLAKIGENKFGFKGSIWTQKRAPRNDCYQLHFASKILKEVFGKMFGIGSRNKKVPNIFYNLNEEQKKAFLKGYFLGDGCLEKTKEGHKVFSLATSSKHLANDLWIMLSSMDIVSAIGKNKKKDSYKIRARGEQLKKLESVCGKVKIGKTQVHGFRMDGNNILLGIKDITTRDYSGKVYDIQTNGSFCVPFVVHNCWIFPKREGTANVGIGIGIDYAKGKTAKQYLDKWIENQEGMKNGSIIEVNAGTIPVGDFLDKMQAERLLVAGDAGHMVDPIHGGGIGIAMEGGRLAGQVAEKALKAENYSEEFLTQYTKAWFDLRGNELKRRLMARHLLEQMNDEDFNYLAESITMEEALAIGDGSLNSKQKAILFGTKLIKRPGLITLFMKYFAK